MAPKQKQRKAYAFHVSVRRRCCVLRALVSVFVCSIYIWFGKWCIHLESVGQLSNIFKCTESIFVSDSTHTPQMMQWPQNEGIRTHTSEWVCIVWIRTRHANAQSEASVVLLCTLNGRPVNQCCGHLSHCSMSAMSLWSRVKLIFHFANGIEFWSIEFHLEKYDISWCSLISIRMCFFCGSRRKHYIFFGNTYY